MSEGDHRTHLRTITREDLGQVEVLQDRHLLVTLKGSPAKVIFLLPLKELEVADPQAVHLGFDGVGDGRVAATFAGGVASPPSSSNATGANGCLDLEGLFSMKERKEKKKKNPDCSVSEFEKFGTQKLPPQKQDLSACLICAEMRAKDLLSRDRRE